ncbi:hypothetical protein H2200_001255 [Cladophialophora chaetospira]|uniref:Uncharacterized protein n=1 Tax=Cladophialophora chaetospira TaxID=386627 RepID=A0AA38XKN5_9EURO|nr:hypothetical protein H2200_001255 [Cladophialophora chaetospira]
MAAQQYPDSPSLEQELNGLTREELTDLVRHCAPQALVTFYDEARTIAVQGTIDYKGSPFENDGVSHFEYTEHRYLGDQLRLQGWDTAQPNNPAASVNPLKLKNGVSLSYGTINGLAGDFFSIVKPISAGADAKDRSDRFKAAFDTLWSGDPKKIQAILGQLQKEVDGINNILQDSSIPDNGKAIRELYEKMDADLLNPLDVASKTGSNPGASYKELLTTNLDHFAPNSRIIYDTGHAWALEVAVGQDLPRAYAINAFADHFLEDNFASGHLRVPRGDMMDNLAKNICVNMMHNEDNTRGVQVKSQGSSTTPSTSWRAYGDSMLFDDVSKPGKTQCYSALKASVDEVYEAYKTRTAKPATDFKAWDHAPTMTPALETPQSHDKENHPPMFRVVDGKVWQRKGLLPYKGEVSKNTKWEYEPVVGKGPKIPLTDISLVPQKYQSYLEYLYWSILAFRLTPYSTMGTAIKKEVEGWLNTLPGPLSLLAGFWKTATVS